MNNDNFLIESSELYNIKEKCGYINDSETRERAVANFFAAEIAKKYFTEIELDEVTTLHEIPFIQEKLEISDIYIKNNYIEVRLCIDDEPLLIPQYNYENGILPLAYMFIKTTAELASATIIGFILPTDIVPEKISNGYISIPEDSLVSYYDVVKDVYMHYL